jgi:plasmid stabilization system protein ParE
MRPPGWLPNLSRPPVAGNNPAHGRQVPEFHQEHIRELVIVKPYRIIYTVKDDVCRIVAVVHGRRDLTQAINLEDIEANGE